MRKLLVYFFTGLLMLAAGCGGGGSGGGGNPGGDNNSGGDNNTGGECPSADRYGIIHIKTASDLNCMRYDRGADYVLDNDINLSNWNRSGNGAECTDTTQLDCADGKGWLPLGESGDDIELEFWGSLDGKGHKITGLYINRTIDYVGLFGYGGGVENLTLEDVDITGKYTVGAFIASGGDIINCSASGSVKATGETVYAGGLAGKSINVSYKNNKSSVNVTATGNGTPGNRPAYAGGLAGYTDAIIDNCTSSGTIIANYPGGHAYSGGIVGILGGLAGIKRSSSSGSVTAGGTYADAGGLAGGVEQSTIDNSSSSAIVNANCTPVTGNSTSSCNAGGLAGAVTGCTVNISQSYATGNITIDGGYYSSGGGIIGYLETGCGSGNQSNIINSYTTSNVNVTAYDQVQAGGLAGTLNMGIIEKCYAAGNVSVNYRPRPVGTGGAVDASSTGGLVGYVFASGTINNNSNMATGGGVIGGNVVVDDGSPLLTRILKGDTFIGRYRAKDVKDATEALTSGNFTGAKAKAPYTAAGWDFTNIWQINEGGGYPTLR